MDEPLFSAVRADQIIGERFRRAVQELDDLGEAVGELADSEIAEIAESLDRKYGLQVARLRTDEIDAVAEPGLVDARRFHNRHVSDRSRPFWIPGIIYTVRIPYIGDFDSFRISPNEIDNMKPHSPHALTSSHVVITCHVVEDHDPIALKGEISGYVHGLSRWLGYVERSVGSESIGRRIHQELSSRRARYRSGSENVKAMGFVLRRRSEEESVVGLPSEPRSLIRSKPKRGAGADPRLADSDFDDILDIIVSMTRVMERSPKAFAHMGEEDLRTHYLVQLNGQYKGQATGETFNYDGKTDILVRVRDKNIFIGECKFWTGKKGLSGTIDQILGYLSWHDTKAAIVLFNKNRNFSSVLTKVQEAVRGHPQFASERGLRGETHFRYVLRHPTDADRKVELAVVAFEIPAGD